MEEEIIIIESDEEQEIITIEEDIEYIKPTTQEKTVIPTKEQQIVVPDNGVFALSKVNVEAVTNEIDENIKSENIKKDVSILGVQGNVEELKGTKIEITKNGTYTPAEPYNGFTEVDVNMESVDDYFTNTIGAGDSNVGGFAKTIKKLPVYTNVATDLTRAFAYYQGTTIPFIDTSNVTIMSVFCMSSTITSFPLLDTHNVTLMNTMFSNCKYLTELPPLDTSKNTAYTTFCNGCSALETIPLLNSSNVNILFGAFSGCSNLKNLGGFQNLGQAYLTTYSANYGNYKLDLSSSPKLTHDSLMNVINNLYDIATKGVKTQQIYLGSTNMAKLTAEEIAIATNKGWSVS